ncbi:hypothetical protein AVEN_188703-1 [Araneus ventricosus]|uniref:Peptidase A2 domain-containing protein n=1 Tax=Araneus ventricosus TaxID=182803 RepID=A0A4Y2DAF3_ARAVE|nr:hypothetical protein AVEN_188703-1 [Araneus ventricosus]
MSETRSIDEKFEKLFALMAGLEKKMEARLAGSMLPFLNKAPEEGLKVFTLCGKKNGLYLEGFICGIECSMLVDAGANATLLKTDLARTLKGQLIYTAPSISLNTAAGEKAEIHGKLDASIEYLEKNDIWTVEEEIPLFSASVQHSKLCSVLDKERTIIPARSECLFQGVPEISGQFRYAVADFPSQLSQKGVLVASLLIDLKREAIPV